MATAANRALYHCYTPTTRVRIPLCLKRSSLRAASRTNAIQFRRTYG
jgi:hypothetical protein